MVLVLVLVLVVVLEDFVLGVRWRREKGEKESVFSTMVEYIISPACL